MADGGIEGVGHRWILRVRHMVGGLFGVDALHAGDCLQDLSEACKWK